jgi:hypothetical protein
VAKPATIFAPIRTNILLAFFRGTIAVMCALTFVWPFAISADPSQPVFKWVAIATLILFFASLVLLLIAQSGRARLR